MTPERDARLRTLVEQWRRLAVCDGRDDGTAAEFADELAALLADETPPPEPSHMPTPHEPSDGECRPAQNYHWFPDTSYRCACGAIQLQMHVPHAEPSGWQHTTALELLQHVQAKHVQFNQCGVIECSCGVTKAE